MSDGVSGLQTAIHNAFGEGTKRLMCYYHAKDAMDRKMTSLHLTKNQREHIREGVRFMQRCVTEQEFVKLAELCLQNWRLLESERASFLWVQQIYRMAFRFRPLQNILKASGPIETMPNAAGDGTREHRNTCPQTTRLNRSMATSRIL